MKKLLFSGVFVTLFMFTSCEKIDLIIDDTIDKDKKDDIVCTTSVDPGIVIYNYDINGNPMKEVYGKIINIKTGNIEEVKGGEYISAAYEAAGTYDIHLEAKGYYPFETKDIVVEEDVCHVKTVKLKAVFKPIIDKKNQK